MTATHLIALFLGMGAGTAAPPVVTTPGPYVAFTFGPIAGATTRSSAAVQCTTATSAAFVLSTINRTWPAVKCQTEPNDFFGNDANGLGGLGQQNSAKTQDGSGTFGPFYDGSVLTAAATTFFNALVTAGLSATAPLIVWLDSESQNYLSEYTAAQLHSIAADTRAAGLLAAVAAAGPDPIWALATNAEVEAFNSWVAQQYNAALTLLANAIKAVFPNAVVVNFNSVQISQALEQVDGGGTPYYFSGLPAGGVNSPELYDQLSPNVLLYNYQIHGVSVTWPDPFFNLIFLLNKGNACLATNPANGYLSEIASYYDTNLGDGSLVPLAGTPYWYEHARHQALRNIGGCLLVFNAVHPDDVPADSIAVEMLRVSGGLAPKTTLTTFQYPYTPPDGGYTYVLLSDGVTTLGRYTFAPGTNAVTITTSDNKVYALQRPFGGVGTWFGTAVNPATGVAPSSGFILWDFGKPGTPKPHAFVL